MFRPFMLSPFMFRPFMLSPFMFRPFSAARAPSCDAVSSVASSAQAVTVSVEARAAIPSGLAIAMRMPGECAALVPAADGVHVAHLTPALAQICANWETRPSSNLRNPPMAGS